MVKQRHRTRTILAVGVIIRLLRDRFYDNVNVGRGWGGLINIVPTLESAPLELPTLEGLRLHSIMKFPLPFTPTTEGELGTSHLAEMTSPEYLEEGEWTGVYTMSFGTGVQTSFDPPVKGIRFQTTCQPATRASNVLDLYSPGIDSIGSFNINGSLDRTTGKITANKTYIRYTHLCWSWTCLVTPFGIVGVWGSDHWGGWLWLWKVPNETAMT